MYGSKITSDGKTIVANGINPILTGLCVEGNTIESLALATNPDGSINNSRATLVFLQKNGAKFIHSFWDSTESWAVDQINREMLHICHKIVTEEEYDNIIEEHGNGSFAGFIAAVSEHIIAKAIAEKMEFNLKIVYKENKSSGKWFPNFPKFPNFIERAGTEPCTFKHDPKYDVFDLPKFTTMGTDLDNSGEFPTASDTPLTAVF